MPELPEVEYTARQLRVSVVGATIADAQIFWERTIGHPSVPDFLAEIVDRRIEGVRRRGKFLLFDLSGRLFLSVHRRMTGNFLLLDPGWSLDISLRERDNAAWNTQGPLFHGSSHGDQASGQDARYCRVSLAFTDGRCLLFTDPRKFGKMELWPVDQEDEAFEGLGPEPLGPSFALDSFETALRQRRSPIKQVLLDQAVVAGIGNIYADEALFFASLHPLRPANTLTKDEVRVLHEGIISVLTTGIEHGGTSFNDYRDLWGEAGENFNHVRVYRQEGHSCYRCNTLIERMVIGQRSAHYCPGCQKSPLPSERPVSSC